MAEQFQLGTSNVSLEDTMVALQKANISFQAMVQVRNKVVAAYNDIMNMQI
jgi:flagellar hook-basal body complex protein FliE